MKFVSLGDIEHEPSAPEAFMTAVMENKEWVYENGELIGKNLSESIESYQELVKKTNKKELNAVIIDIFKNYFKKIS